MIDNLPKTATREDLLNSGKCGLPPGYPNDLSQQIGEFGDVIRRILQDRESPQSPGLQEAVDHLLSRCGGSTSLLVYYFCRYVGTEYHPLFTKWR